MYTPRPFAISKGGTGATTAAGARSSLGLGSIATQSASNVAITGGTISGVTLSGATLSGLSSAIAIADGGTGATTAAGARSNLGAAPKAAQFLVLSADSELSDERVFTAGTGISVNDGGAGNAFTVNHAQVASGDLHTEYLKADGTRALGGNLSMGNNRLTSLGTPTAASDAATKAYVDNAITGLDMKQSVRAATTGNITLEDEQTVDDVVLVAGDRVLVKNQTDASENGIYEVVDGGAWVRAGDADNTPNNEVNAGMYCFVEEGSTNGNTGWVLATDNPITLDTTDLTFVKFMASTGALTGGGAAGRLAFWDGASSLTSSAGLKYDDSTTNLDLVGATAATFIGEVKDYAGTPGGWRGIRSIVNPANATNDLWHEIIADGYAGFAVQDQAYLTGPQNVNRAASIEIDDGTHSGPNGAHLVLKGAAAAPWYRMVADAVGGKLAIRGWDSGNDNVKDLIEIDYSDSSVAIAGPLLVGGAEAEGAILATKTADATMRFGSSVFYSALNTLSSLTIETAEADGSPWVNLVNSHSNPTDSAGFFAELAYGGATETGTFVHLGAHATNAILRLKKGGVIGKMEVKDDWTTISSEGGELWFAAEQTTDTGAIDYLSMKDWSGSGDRRVSIHNDALLFFADNSNIDLPNHAGARFKIDDTTVGPSVTAANLTAVTDGSAADSQHKHVVLTFSGSTKVEATSTGASITGVAVATGGFDANNQKLINLATPTSGTDAATKAYVDAVVSGLDVKKSVRAATAANITLEDEQTIDGVALVAGDRVLVKNQSTASENGIYVVVDGGAWTRAADADSDAEVTAGMFAFVEEGTMNGDSGWVLATNDPITVGTTALAFTQFSGAGQIDAGLGLSKTGNVLNVNVDDATIEISSDTLRVKDLGITTAKLNDLAVTTAKIDDLAVSTAKLAALAVTTAKLAATSVTAAKLGSDVAGNGLTGGNGSALAVLAEDGSITVGASGIKVGTISDAQHGNRGGGSLHAAADASAAGFMSATDFKRMRSMTSVASVSADYTLDPTTNFQGVVLVDATAEAVDVTLPATGLAEMKIIRVKKIDGTSNVVTVKVPTGVELDGDEDGIFELTLEDEAVTLINDGTNWFVF